MRRQHNLVILVTQIEHTSHPVQFRHQGRQVIWQRQLHPQPPRFHLVLNLLQQLRHPFARHGGNRHAVRMLVQRKFNQRRIRHPVDLVEHHHHLLAPGIELFQHRLHRFHLLLVKRMTQIDDMQQKIRFGDLFQRRLERFDEMVRQLF